MRKLRINKVDLCHEQVKEGAKAEAGRNVFQVFILSHPIILPL